jgi:hypothetical protein
METVQKKKKSSFKKKLIIIFSIFTICIFLGTLALIPKLIMSDMVNSHMEVMVYNSEDYMLESDEMILTTADGLDIATWEVETENPKGVVILLSGIQNPSVTAFWGYSKMLQDNGYASLLIEMRAHGKSEGERVDLGMSEYLDVLAGVNYINQSEKYEDTPIIVWGTSMGGTTAINAIGEIPDIDGLISCSAFSSWQDVFGDNMLNMDMPSILVKMERPFVSLYMGLLYGFDKLHINPVNEIQKLGSRPALIMHSTEDSQVPYASFERIMEVAGDHVETFVREGDYHFICYDKYMEDPIKDEEFSSAVINFLNKNFQ